MPGLLLCVLLAGCGTQVAADGGPSDPPPERSTREGQPVRLDGRAGIESIVQTAPAELLVVAGERRTGLRPECRRYSDVRVLAETATSVTLAAYAYEPTWEVEPQCPLVPGDSATHTVSLAQPLADRDVVEGGPGLPLYVVDREVPGRTAVRGTRSCGVGSTAMPYLSVDHAHFVRHAGRTYVNQVGADEPEPVFGEELGRVTCTLSGSLTPLRGYVWQDGHSGFLEAGTPYYAVAGGPVEEAVGAVWNGRRTLFEHAPEHDG